METSNLSDGEFKTLSIRMLKEFSQDLDSIKKTVRNERYTNLNKEQFTGKQQESGWSPESMFWNIRKQKQPIRTKRRKKNPEK